MEPPSAASALPFELPHVNVLFWKNEDSKLCHVALQILSPGKSEFFISFWNGPLTDAHREKCGAEAHFHQTLEQDEQVLGGLAVKKIELYSLKIPKLIAAYRQFSQNPKRIGSLGYGIISKPYPKNAVGLTYYLLVKGGIFELTPGYNDSVFNRIFRIMAYVGPLFTLFNLFSIHQLISIKIPDIEDEESRKIEGFLRYSGITTRLCRESFEKLKDIHQRLFKIHDSLERVEAAQSLRQQCLDIISLVQIASYILKRPMEGIEGVFIIQTPTRSLNQVIRRVATTSFYIFLPTVFCSISYYLKNRFFQKTVDHNEIEIIATKAQKRDKRSLHQKLETLLNIEPRAS